MNKKLIQKDTAPEMGPYQYIEIKVN